MFGTPDMARKEPSMKILCHACIVAAAAVATLPAHAEILRCNGNIAAEGDSRLSVLYKCGEPLLKDAYCAPVYRYKTWHPVPEPYAGALFPCQPVEEWLYERGPGNLAATVRFQGGVVQSISYGQPAQRRE
jgi:hypothetical protein